MEPSTLLWLVGFPLIGAALLGLSTLTGKWIPDRWAGWIASGLLFLSFTRAFAIMSEYFGAPHLEPTTAVLGSWMTVNSYTLTAALRADALTAVMVLIVTLVGLMIHLYSIGYMAHDTGRVRYFAYLNLFCFFMLLLVTASSLPLLFVGWEGVGLCSYLLIGFWFKERVNAAAGKKAFLVNRIGDAGFLLGIFLVFSVFGALDFETLSKSPLLGGLAGNWALEMIALLFFIGCIGKSAQFPLYIWLPDAMAGPTPVSALIHAATMVTAGVYLIARMSFLYAVAPVTSEVVALVGAFTALFAATIAITQQDIKKVLAFSTVSQLGFMVLAMGVGSYNAGIFHLVTHAFFKALLFLAAGSVIHAMHGEQNIQKMGGLKTYLMSTTLVFGAGYLAIIGFPGFSGWFSKDEILVGALTSTVSNHMAVFWVGFVAALLTAFYMTRLFCLVFLDITRAPKQKLHEIHESPRIMLWPMWVLVVFSILGGTGLFRFREVLEEALPRAHGSEHLPVFGTESAMAWTLTLSVLVVAGVGGLAFTRWKKKTAVWAEKVMPLSRLMERQYRYDDVMIFAARVSSQLAGTASRLFDARVIDGSLHRVADLVRGSGSALSRLQSGFVQAYALTVLIGAFVMAWYFYWGTP